MRQRIATYMYSIQNDLVHAIEQLDPSKTFNRHNWAQHINNSTGGGTTYTFENGQVFDKAVVQVYIDSGSLSPFQAIEMLSSRPSVQTITKSLNDSFTYYKASLSSVLYPKNPKVPTAFLDIAYNEIKNTTTGKTLWWFSGGSDIASTQAYPEDEKEYFDNYKMALDQFDPTYFDRFREECEKYTYMPHREETRSQGGIYFSELNHDLPDNLLHTVIDCCTTQYIESLKPLLNKRKDLPWTLEEKDRQSIQNSRFVEFELVKLYYF